MRAQSISDWQPIELVQRLGKLGSGTRVRDQHLSAVLQQEAGEVQSLASEADDQGALALEPGLRHLRPGQEQPPGAPSPCSPARIAELPGSRSTPSSRSGGAAEPCG